MAAKSAVLLITTGASLGRSSSSTSTPSIATGCVSVTGGEASIEPRLASLRGARRRRTSQVRETGRRECVAGGWWPGCVLVTVTGCTGGSAAPSTSGSPATTGPTPATTNPTTAPVVDPLVGRLRAGGLTLYFRHAVTDQSRQDDPSPDLSDRSTQRNLSDVGRRQATAIGEAIRALAIPIGPVLASPYARAVETGELAFGPGRVRGTRDLLNEAYPGTDDADLARRLAGPARPATARRSEHRPHRTRVRARLGGARTSPRRPASRSRRVSARCSNRRPAVDSGWSPACSPTGGRRWPA